MAIIATLNMTSMMFDFAFDPLPTIVKNRDLMRSLSNAKINKLRNRRLKDIIFVAGQRSNE
ncbi:hypothetical protein [Pedobacter sp. V48]|uniref:hypothetical protein n=1 Tax=Pedobacter sp. V48 TaxID=509635 RepID=UPI0012690864|nr:hypothetical protein [Pedobacter sp. V48]